MTYLRPCPFCGSDQLQFVRNEDLMIFGVYCRNCKAMVKFTDNQMQLSATYGENEKRWVEAWNERN